MMLVSLEQLEQCTPRPGMLIRVDTTSSYTGYRFKPEIRLICNITKRFNIVSISYFKLRQQFSHNQQTIEFITISLEEFVYQTWIERKKFWSNWFIDANHINSINVLI